MASSDQRRLAPTDAMTIAPTWAVRRPRLVTMPQVGRLAIRHHVYSVGGVGRVRLTDLESGQWSGIQSSMPICKLIKR